MKGIVVDINNNDAVILTDSGLFTKVKNQNYAVGQAIKIQERRKIYSKWVAGAASMAAAFAVCTIGAYAWFTPTDYVSLDVNPSVEYSLNTFERILEVKAVNHDGEEILDGLDLKNMTIEDAVKETLDKLMDEGYLIDDPNGGVVIATSNDKMKDAEKLAVKLEREVQAYLDDQEGIIAEVDAEAVTPERVEAAKALEVTPGKLNLVEKLKASTSGAIDMGEWLTKPVKEINKAIKENRKAEKDKDKPGKQDQEHSKGKDGTDSRNAATTSGIRLNEKQSQEKIDRNKEEIDRSTDQKTDRQKTDEENEDKKTDENASDKEKPQKDDSGRGNGGPSGKDKDHND